MSRKTPTYAERARTYAIDVVAGRVLACAYVRLACQRHLDDLDAQDDPEFPYRFDTEAVEHVGMFVEAMPHIKGRWVERRERLLLEDWQCFVLAVPFGWVRKSDGLRRYRRVYIEVPRKNGKSSLTAALGLYMFAADGEHGAEVYSGAGSEKQAWEVFGPARLMARGLPDLQEAYGIEVNAKNLSIPESASKFEPIIGKPGDGASPSFSITDEYHEHATDEQYDTMVTGMGAREQPMAWVITTAGSDIAGPCYALRTEVVKALEGSVENDQLFGLVYTLDDGDDWTTEEALRKANPNFGVSVFRDYLLGQQRDAINNVRKQNTFKTKHLNVWVQARDPWMNMELWNRCADAPPISEFAGEPCWLAVDMANKYDIACSAKVFRREMDDGTHYYAYVRSYLPEDQAEAPEKQHYQTWMHDGHLTATDGNIIDYAAIEADVRTDAATYRVMELGFDPWNAAQFAQNMAADGMTTVEIPQNVRHLSEPMKQIEALVMAGRFHHTGNPVLDWCISNVKAKEDANENIFPRKESRDAKIDGAVAVINAMARALVGEVASTGSIYDERGIDFF